VRVKEQNSAGVGLPRESAITNRSATHSPIPAVPARRVRSLARRWPGMSSWITLDLYRKRPGGQRSKSGTRRGPGRFGSSRKKEAAGAAWGMPLAMGFECRVFPEESGGGWDSRGEKGAAPSGKAWKPMSEASA
jgi:hypothetical protein